MRRNVLIARLDRIGDAVLATPLPREIKRAWPDAQVAVLVRGASGAVFKHDPHVDMILADDHGPGTAAASFWVRVRQLRRQRFTHGLVLRADSRAIRMLAAAGIRGRAAPGLTIDHLLTLTRPVAAAFPGPGRHDGDLFLQMLGPLGIAPETTVPEIHLTADERRQTALRRDEWSAGDRFVVGVHATSGGSAPNWAPVGWAQLATRLVADPRVCVVLTDRNVPADVAGVAGVVAPNRRAALREALVNFAALDLLISASTGPMHVAGALGVPTLSLFCPLENCAPERRGPRGNRALHVLPEPGYCSARCPGDPCACTFADSREISPDLVAARVLHQAAQHGDEIRSVASLGPDPAADSA